jgi:membrane-associated phospholipid phosphatase
VTERFLAFLGRDLREALDAGARRTPALSPDGDLWLSRWALVSAVSGLALYLLYGYHAGFVPLNGLAAQVPVRIWEWLTVLGDERVAFALTLFFTRRYPRIFWSLIVAALLGIAYTHALKPLFSAPRPPAVLDSGTFNLIGPGHRKVSFPSGHTVTAAVFFGVWVYFVRSTWLRAGLILVAVAAGLSRVAVGVHWPVDVAAGLTGGVLAAWLGALLARRSEWGIRLAAVHLAFLILAVAIAASLLLWDGGYRGAAAVQRLLGVAALSYAAYAYLIDPVLRWSGLRQGTS